MKILKDRSYSSGIFGEIRDTYLFHNLQTRNPASSKAFVSNIDLNIENNLTLTHKP